MTIGSRSLHPSDLVLAPTSLQRLHDHIVTFAGLFSFARVVFLARKLTAARGSLAPNGGGGEPHNTQRSQGSRYR
jgi:hypothetical protein